MSSQHTYSSLYPNDIQVKPSIKQFFEDYYRISDTEAEHEAWVGHFSEGAEFVLASKSVKGAEEILTLRKSMWTNVSRRLHTPLKIFPFGSNSNEFMLFGTVEYSFRDGGEGKVDWAGYAKLVEEGGGLKFAFYQVYLDSAAVKAK